MTDVKTVTAPPDTGGFMNIREATMVPDEVMMEDPTFELCAAVARGLLLGPEGFQSFARTLYRNYRFYMTAGLPPEGLVKAHVLAFTLDELLREYGILEPLSAGMEEVAHE
jgi:hypothetical protein